MRLLGVRKVKLVNKLKLIKIINLHIFLVNKNAILIIYFDLFLLTSSMLIAALWGIGFHSTLRKSAINIDKLPISPKIGKVIQNQTFLYHLIGIILLRSIIKI